MTLEEFVMLYNEQKRNLKPKMYSKIIEAYKKAIAHTRGENLGVLLKDYRVQEEWQQTKRREEVLEPITKDMFDRTSDKLTSVLAPELVQITADESVFDLMQDQEFWAFLDNVIIPNMIDDPNAFLCALPKIESQNEPVDVLFWVVNYEYVLSFDDEHLAFRKQVEGVDYVYYLSKTIAKRMLVNEDGKLVDDDSYEVLYDFPILPYIQLGGRLMRAKNNDGYFSSYFSSAFAQATKAIQIFSDREAMRMTANPVVVMQKKPCDNEGCTSGQIYGLPDIPDGEICGVCDGSGFIQQRWNINDVLYVDKEDLGEAINLDNFAKFLQPPTEMVDLTDRYHEAHLKKAEQALNLIFVDQAQSGTAKEIDREMQDAMINVIAKNVYNRLVKFAFQVASYFLGFEDQVTVVIPEDFRYSSPSAILTRITELKEKNAPMGILYPIYRKLYVTMYANDPISKRKSLFQLDYDPLHMYVTITDKRLASANDREFEFSKQLPSALNRLSNNLGQEAFLELDDNQMLEQVTAFMTLPQALVELRNGNGE